MSASINSGTYPRATRSTPGGLQRFGASVWQAMVQLGAHRAHPELMRLSRLKAQSDPALSRQLRDAARDLLKG